MEEGKRFGELIRISGFSLVGCGELIQKFPRLLPLSAQGKYLRTTHLHIAIVAGQVKCSERKRSGAVAHSILPVCPPQCQEQEEIIRGFSPAFCSESDRLVVTSREHVYIHPESARRILRGIHF
jgi:hypothetical protein